MDLLEYRRSYKMAGQQIAVLEKQLSDLQTRKLQHGYHDNITTENYLTFKIETLKSILKMYEEYQDMKWKELQREGSRELNQILHGDNGISESDLDIHMFPSPISPIPELYSSIPSIYQHRHYHYRESLVNTMSDDLLEYREV